MDWTHIIDSPFIPKLISTIVLIVVAVGIRSFIVRKVITHKETDATTRRRWIVTTRNTTFLIILTVVIVIWLEQLRTVAATVVVIAAAIVIATKEFLLNILGFIYQSSAKFVSIGDRIEIDGIRGDVVDISMLGITMLEIGSGEKTNQYTGLTIHVPNSKFLAATVKNETHMWGDYVFHLITIPVDNNQEWTFAEKALLQAANEVSAPFLKSAAKSMKSLARRHSLDEPSVEPRVNIQVAATDKINLILRTPVPTRHRGRLEQDITRRYLQIMTDRQDPSNQSSASAVQKLDEAASVVSKAQ